MVLNLSMVCTSSEVSAASNMIDSAAVKLVGLTRACDTSQCIKQAGYSTSVASLLPGWVGSTELILNNNELFIVYIHDSCAVKFVLTNNEKQPFTLSESKYMITYCQIWEHKLLLF